MSFPWFSIAKYSGVVLSFSGLGAGVCSLIHEKPEEIKHEEELPEEIKKQLDEDLKTKVKIPEENIENVKAKFTFANRKNVAYGKVVECFIGEQKRLIEDKKYNAQFFSWSSSRRDVTPKYNQCFTDNPIPTS